MAKAKMTKPEIMTLFANMKNLELLRRDVQAYITDKQNSFEDRLAVYLDTPTGLKSSAPWILHLEEFEDVHGEINWFDDFYCSRHEDVDLTNFMRDKSDYSTTEEWTDEKFRAFQEAVLNEGVHSFNLDW